MSNWAEVFRDICTARPDRFEAQAFVLSFIFDKAVTTIRVVLQDQQSGADMVITNMTTLPESETRKGYGSAALQQLLHLALENGLVKIQAVQVQVQSEQFWTRNGFRKIGNITNDFMYTPTGNVSS